MPLHRVRTLATALGGVLCCLAVAGLGVAHASAPQSKTVTIEQSGVNPAAFDTKLLRVPVGTTVVFANHTSFSYTVTAQGYSSGSIPAGGTSPTDYRPLAGTHRVTGTSLIDNPVSMSIEADPASASPTPAPSRSAVTPTPTVTPRASTSPANSVPPSLAPTSPEPSFPGLIPGPPGTSVAPNGPGSPPVLGAPSSGGAVPNAAGPGPVASTEQPQPRALGLAAVVAAVLLAGLAAGQVRVLLAEPTVPPVR